MAAALASLFAQTPVELLAGVTYLCQGRIAPAFAGVDLGLAERLAAKAVARAAGVEDDAVAEALRTAGDLGTAAELLLERRGGGHASLEVAEALAVLHSIARAAGPGSQAHKIELLASLLGRATPLEACYLVRIVTGTLRVGAGDATILDAVAQGIGGSPEARAAVERAYNICSDLGLVARTLRERGPAGLAELRVEPGRPVRPMLAQRATTPAEALARLGGRCAAEYKYDGVRVQAHVRDGHVELYTRRLERVGDQFPDAVEALLAGLRAPSAVLEGELVACDEGGELRPFQELMQRRRTHGVEAAARLLPVTLYAFDLLAADGCDLTGLPYPKRRLRLEQALAPSPRLRLATRRAVSSAAELEEFFQLAIADGCEGLVCKAVGPKSTYQAGARGWLWVKLKRDYRSELRDTLDLVVVGAFHGRGARGGSYGSVLLAAYDPQRDAFCSVCKCGTGLTEAHLAELRRRLEPLVRASAPPRVHTRVVPDVWAQPEVVLEVTGAELTLSPVHTAAWGRARPGSGLALRFPRFTGRFRDDKRPEDATTVDEVWELYRRALRRVAGAEAAGSSPRRG